MPTPPVIVTRAGVGAEPAEALREPGDQPGHDAPRLRGGQHQDPLQEQAALPAHTRAPPPQRSEEGGRGAAQGRVGKNPG